MRTFSCSRGYDTAAHDHPACVMHGSWPTNIPYYKGLFRFVISPLTWHVRSRLESWAKQRWTSAKPRTHQWSWLVRSDHWSTALSKPHCMVVVTAAGVVIWLIIRHMYCRLESWAKQRWTSAKQRTHQWSWPVRPANCRPAHQATALRVKISACLPFHGCFVQLQTVCHQ